MEERSERLGGGDPLAVKMRGRGRLLAVLVLVRLDPGAVLPELAHGNGAAPEVRQGVHRHDLGQADASGFALLDDAPRLGKPAETAEVVLRDAVGDRLAVIVQEAIGHLGTADDVAGQRRQIGPRIVAPPPAELLDEVRRPVRQPDLPTVDLHRAENLVPPAGPHRRSTAGQPSRIGRPSPPHPAGRLPSRRPWATTTWSRRPSGCSRSAPRSIVPRAPASPGSRRCRSAR